jgi:hypothetical protein
MEREAGDRYAVALAMQDQSRAAAMDWLRESRQFALSVFDAEGTGGLIVSALGEPADCAAFVLTSLVALWESLHEITGENDAELFARLVAGLAMTRDADH